MNDRQPSPPLDEDAAALLGAYRAETEMPAELSTRVWDRLETAAPTVGPSTGWSIRGVMIGMAAAAAVIGLWIGAQSLRERSTRAPAEQAGYQQTGPASPRATETRERDTATTSKAAHAAPAPTPEPSTPLPSNDSPQDDAGATVVPAPSDASVPAKHRTPAPSRSPATPVDSLAEENRVLSQARNALLERAPERALKYLRDHARRFPNGVLSPERRALRAIALCEADRNTEGTAAARSYLKMHPQSTLAARVRNACLE